MSNRTAALAIALAGACATPPAPPTEAKPPAPAFTATPGARAVVARVDGEPVFADCVKRQAEGRGIAKDAALEECIAFQLLANEARDRRLLERDDVKEVARLARVRALIDTDYYETYNGPDSLPREEMAAMWKGMPITGLPLTFKYNMPPSIALSYCQFPVPTPKPPSANASDEALEKYRKTLDSIPTESAKAEALARHFHLLVRAIEASGRHLSRTDLLDLCRRVHTFPDESLALARPVKMPLRAVNELSADVRAAAKAAGVGVITAPVEDRIGWLVIHVDAIQERGNSTFENALPEIRRVFWDGDFLPTDTEPTSGDRAAGAELRGYRRNLFVRWSNPLLAKHEIEADFDAVPTADEDEILAGGSPTQ